MMCGGNEIVKENIVNYIPLKVYRYLRWRMGQRKAYEINKNNFCEEYAKLCNEAEKLAWKKKSSAEILAAYDAKHRFVVDYLEELCADVIQKYEMLQWNPKPFNGEKKIWVFWWTGEENAPDIVKACIKSIRENANGHEVVFLDQNNYQEYVQFPEYILEKHQNGTMIHAIFSDLLRLSLLTTYGGVWIDATVFVSQPLPQEIFDSNFYSLKTYYHDSNYYSKSRWCSYFLAGDPTTLLYVFAREFLMTYWQRSETLVDYLLTDYAFGIAYDHFEIVKNAVDLLPENNFKRGMLMEAINEPYSEKLFQILKNEETFASKLSWRYGNPTEKTKNGELTNYGHLLRM